MFYAMLDQMIFFCDHRLVLEYTLLLIQLSQLQDGSSGDDFGKDSVERDERRLTELGRRTVEMFVLAHLYTYVPFELLTLEESS